MRFPKVPFSVNFQKGSPCLGKDMSDQNFNRKDSYNELLSHYPPVRDNSGQPPRRPADGNARPAPSPKPADPGISFNRPNNEDVAPRTYRTPSGTGNASPSGANAPSGQGNAVRRPATAQPAGAGRSTGAAPAPAGPQKSPAAVPASATPVNHGPDAGNTTPKVSHTANAIPTSDVPNEEEIRQQKKIAKKKKKRAMRRKSNLQSLLLVALVLVFVFVAAIMIKIPIMGCVNDLLAMDRDSTQQRVVVEDGMNVDDIIDLLADKGLIYSAPFCKLAAELLDYSKEDVYPQGEYDLSPDMGLEAMLKEIISAGVKKNTITLTFPEGYTVDQIVNKLNENNVVSAKSMYEAMAGDEIIEKYDFLIAIEDREDRYNILEGYLYPDTYEFYIGEDPNSVLEKFLDNFAKKWTEEYEEAAEEQGMTVDEIITLASILEKEANDAQQMPLISSILYNRIRSTSFPFINCDSTLKYLETIQQNVSSDEQYQHLTASYDTYVKTGLPVGAICNPGADAIKAALHPDDTNYYYFLHDAEGKIYVASTAEEHEANKRNLEG